MLETDEPSRIEVDFIPEGRSRFTVPLDWWYETLSQAGEIAEKSAWKMYAGQQTVLKIVTDMVKETTSLPEPNSIAELLTARAPMSGRFGFDPRSSRDALNAGFQVVQHQGLGGAGEIPEGVFQTADEGITSLPVDGLAVPLARVA